MENKTNCPICLSDANSHTVVQTPSWRVERCERCRNAYTIPSPITLNYQSESKHILEIDHLDRIDRLPLPHGWRAYITKQVNIIRSLCRPPARVLDIGCGQGILLYQLTSLGYSAVGVEPSMTASAFGRRQNLEVFQGYFPHRDIHGTFGFVNCSQVLEHLQDLHGTLSAIEHVAKGGYVMFTQTNYEGWMPRMLGANWYAWVPEEHFWHFTPAGMRKILEARGWTFVKVYRSNLIHHGRRGMAVRCAGMVIPQLRDQFHLVMRVPGTV